MGFNSRQRKLDEKDVVRSGFIAFLCYVKLPRLGPATQTKIEVLLVFDAGHFRCDKLTKNVFILFLYILLWPLSFISTRMFWGTTGRSSKLSLK